MVKKIILVISLIAVLFACIVPCSAKTDSEVIFGGTYNYPYNYRIYTTNCFQVYQLPNQTTSSDLIYLYNDGVYVGDVKNQGNTITANFPLYNNSDGIYTNETQDRDIANKNLTYEILNDDNTPYSAIRFNERIDLSGLNLGTLFEMKMDDFFHDYNFQMKLVSFGDNLCGIKSSGSILYNRIVEYDIYTAQGVFKEHVSFTEEAQGYVIGAIRNSDLPEYECYICNYTVRCETNGFTPVLSTFELFNTVYFDRNIVEVGETIPHGFIYNNDSWFRQNIYNGGFNDGLEIGWKEGYQQGLENGGHVDNQINRSWVDWIVVAVSGFLDFEIVPNISIGGILSVSVGVALFMLFLKLFSGG